jgi:hypothetical protein
MSNEGGAKKDQYPQRTAANYIQYHAQTDINHVSLLKHADKTVNRNSILVYIKNPRAQTAVEEADSEDRDHDSESKETEINERLN